MSSSTSIQNAGKEEIEQLNVLLQQEGLPRIGPLRSDDQYWVMRHDEQVVAGIGLERYGDSGLLRSLVTDAAWRSRGLAGRLLEKLEKYALEQGVTDLFLLTETAENWFRKKGYREIGRDEAPGPISLSDEFASLCPASARLMEKKI